MKTILITGRMGAGKSQLLSLIEKRAYPVFSADEAAKNLLRMESPCYEELKKILEKNNPNPDFYQAEGLFHKKKLADFLFKNPEKKKALEQIIHPQVRALFKAFVEKESRKKSSSYLFYEAPLLSKEILKSCGFSVLVVSSCPRREERLLQLGWTKREIEQRLSAQIPEEEVIKSVDFIIENNKDTGDLEKQLDILLEKLKEN